MSLDFFVTQFYRLIVHDLVLMSDVYWFYSQSRSEGKSIQEFSEVIKPCTWVSSDASLTVSCFLIPTDLGEPA